MKICKLCRKNNDLKESHIIPEAFYEGIYDKKHRAVPISTENSKIEVIQKGIRERLLCGSCEQKLSKWETIFKRDLIDIGNRKSRFLSINHPSEKLLKVEGIRYREFKLAALSILWRMSITSAPFFAAYKLGNYEEKLRKVLLDENVPDEKRYPILVLRCELEEVFYPEMIMGFPPGKYDKVFTIQSFIIWGHQFIIFVNDKEFPRIPIESFLRNSGELYVRTRSLEDLASPKSVFSKLDDEQVESAFARMM